MLPPILPDLFSSASLARFESHTLAPAPKYIDPIMWEEMVRDQGSLTYREILRPKEIVS